MNLRPVPGRAVGAKPGRNVVPGRNSGNKKNDLVGNKKVVGPGAPAYNSQKWTVPSPRTDPPLPPAPLLTPQGIVASVVGGLLAQAWGAINGALWPAATKPPNILNDGTGTVAISGATKIVWDPATAKLNKFNFVWWGCDEGTTDWTIGGFEYFRNNVSGAHFERSGAGDCGGFRTLSLVVRYAGGGTEVLGSVSDWRGFASYPGGATLSPVSGDGFPAAPSWVPSEALRLFQPFDDVAPDWSEVAPPAPLLPWRPDAPLLPPPPPAEEDAQPGDAPWVLPPAPGETPAPGLLPFRPAPSPGGLPAPVPWVWPYPIPGGLPFPGFGPDGRPLPVPVEPAPGTRPDVIWLPSGPIGGPGVGPRPDLVAIAQELGRLEQKAELQLLDPGPPPVDLGPILDRIDALEAAMEAATAPLAAEFAAGQYELQPPCEYLPDGSLRGPDVAEWPDGEGGLAEISRKVDALAELLQFHKTQRQPTCRRGGVVGEGVTVEFVQV